MGTSVSVAKYIKAPATEANRLAQTELPPRRDWIHCPGISAAWPGRPSMNPATSTPPASSGKICFIKSQVDATQLLHSSAVNHALSMNPRTMSNAAVIYHLTENRTAHSPVEPGAGLAKAANTRISTIVRIYKPSCSSVRPVASASGT